MLKTPKHPDEFGYTEQGYKEWMLKNNPVKKPMIKTFTTADPIVQKVLARVNRRSEQGLKTYGVSMMRPDVDTIQWLRHAQEEALDLAVYLERCIHDLEQPEEVPHEVF